MNKITTLFIALFLCFNMSFAQYEVHPEPVKIERIPPYTGPSYYAMNEREAGDEVYADDFSDFSNWTVATIGGTTAEWELVTTTPFDLSAYVGIMMSPTNANGFGVFNGISDLLSGEVNPIDAILSCNTSIDCSADVPYQIEFFAAYRAFNSDAFYVEVTNDDWATFESYEIFTDLYPNDPTVQEYVNFDISAVTSGESNVKVRFRFTELSGDDFYGGGYGAMVDDLVIRESYEYDLEILKTYNLQGADDLSENGLEYYKLPLEQVDNMSFSATLRSNGSVDLTEAKLNVTATGPDIYTGTSTPMPLSVGSTDSVFCTVPFTPTLEGSYAIKYWVDSESAEMATYNDTLTIEPILITGEDEGFEFARDNGIGIGSIANVAGNSGSPFLIGNTMRITVDDTISAMSIVISDEASNIGQLIFGQLMVFDEDAADFIYLDQTADYEITGDDLGNTIKISFENNIALNEGQTILILAGHYGGLNDVAFQTAQRTATSTVLGYDGSFSLFSLINPRAIMVRAHMETIDFTDTDGDSIYDIHELDEDTDGDDIPNFEDPDDDGDGIPTIDEGEEDTDGDGIVDYLDTDDDNDGIPTEDEEPTDSDDDGTPNYLDNDDDGDGIPTEDELDRDDDDIFDDSDEDEIPDYLDTDDDNDGIPTIDEGDIDTDEDDIPNYLDTDDDGDTIPTEDEATTDTDGDGNPDYLDDDDDNDGVPTADEWDVDGDGIPDDDDEDGIPNHLEISLDGLEEIPGLFSIEQNFPNPFDERTVIQYELLNAGMVSVEIRDATGKIVTQINREKQTVGTYTIELDGDQFASGTYFYTFHFNDFSLTKKMTVK